MNTDEKATQFKVFSLKAVTEKQVYERRKSIKHESTLGYKTVDVVGILKIVI